MWDFAQATSRLAVLHSPSTRSLAVAEGPRAAKSPIARSLKVIQNYTLAYGMRKSLLVFYCNYVCTSNSLK